MKYIFTVKMAKTNCKKNRLDTLCTIPENPANALVTHNINSNITILFTISVYISCIQNTYVVCDNTFNLLNLFLSCLNAKLWSGASHGWTTSRSLKTPAKRLHDSAGCFQHSQSNKLHLDLLMSKLLVSLLVKNKFFLSLQSF